MKRYALILLRTVLIALSLALCLGVAAMVWIVVLALQPVQGADLAIMALPMAAIYTAPFAIALLALAVGCRASLHKWEVIGSSALSLAALLPGAVLAVLMMLS